MITKELRIGKQMSLTFCLGIICSLEQTVGYLVVDNLKWCFFISDFVTLVLGTKLLGLNEFVEFTRTPHFTRSLKNLLDQIGQQ